MGAFQKISFQSFREEAGYKWNLLVLHIFTENYPHFPDNSKPDDFMRYFFKKKKKPQRNSIALFFQIFWSMEKEKGAFSLQRQHNNTEPEKDSTHLKLLNTSSQHD